MDIQSLVLDVKEYTEQRMERYIEELRELYSIDSYCYNKPGLDEMALWLAARMRGLGMDVNLSRREQWGNDLVGVAHGRGEGKIVLLGHTDTIYPLGIVPKLPIRIGDNKAYGPGVADMKGCLLSALYAIEALVSTGHRSFGEIRFLCTSDEEVPDRRHSKDLMEQICQGCQAALGLQDARPNGDIVSARKGWTYYKLTVRGHVAHAGNEPEKGRNAIMELIHQVTQFQSLNGWREGLTISPNIISGGKVVNMLPEYAEATFDIRFLHSEDRIATEERWHEMMQHHVVPDVELSLEVSASLREPMKATTESMKLISLAQKLATGLGFTLNHTVVASVSDANYAFLCGIPVIDGLGPIGGLDHTTDEYLQLDSVPVRTALLAGLIISIGG